MNKLFIGIAIGLIVGGLIGYFLSGLIIKSESEFVRNQNFQIDENTKNEIINFFDSNPSDEEIENYCQENRMYCMYYCMEINQNHSMCKEYPPPQNMKK